MKQSCNGLFREILALQDPPCHADHAARLDVVDHTQGRTLAGRAAGEGRGDLRFGAASVGRGHAFSSL